MGQQQYSKAILAECRLLRRQGTFDQADGLHSPVVVIQFAENDVKWRAANGHSQALHGLP